MKIDRAKLKKTMPTGGDSVPSELKSLVAKLKDGTEDQIIQLLTGFNEWTHKQTDLHHWMDVLDKFDSILASCATRSSESVYCLAVDLPANENMLTVLKLILNFTILLIKHSFSLHVYTSFDHLSSLLLSSNMEVVTLTLDLLIALYKRCSNYTSSPLDRKPPGLKARLSLLAENWGGKEHGVSLSQCAQEWGGKPPASVENFVFEFQRPLTISSSSTTVLGIIPGTNTIGATNLPSSGATVTTEKVKIEVLEVYNRVKLGTTDLVKLNTDLAAHYRVPEESKEQFWFRLRLAANMGDLKQRQLCVQARLLAIGVNASSESSFQFSPQLLDEIVALLSLPGLYELKGTALRTLRAFIAHDRHSKLKIMLDATGLNSYHGLLPNMVRSAINLLVNADNDPKAEKLPRKYTIPLFSFVFHFGYYEAGRTAMNQVNIIEHLLKLVQCQNAPLDSMYSLHSRAIKIIETLTSRDMGILQSYNGLLVFVQRLEYEVNTCRVSQPYEIKIDIPSENGELPLSTEASSSSAVAPVAAGSSPSNDTETAMQVDQQPPPPTQPNASSSLSSSNELSSSLLDTAPNSILVSASDSNLLSPASRCPPLRASLVKSLVNFLRKATQYATLSEHIRPLMTGNLAGGSSVSFPATLRHLISNPEYYGTQVFSNAIELVALYIHHEPSLLSTIQQNGLSGVILHSLFSKPNIPFTRDVVGTLPNVLTALCLNANGLNSFVQLKPFDKIYAIFTKPEYLVMLQTAPTIGTTGASTSSTYDNTITLAKAVDQLIRHQPSLRIPGLNGLVRVLEELIKIGNDPKYVAKKERYMRSGSSGHGNEPVGGKTDASDTRTEVPILDYIVNVMRFLQTILSSTTQHSQEFIRQHGLTSILSLLTLPIIPKDFAFSNACYFVSTTLWWLLKYTHDKNIYIGVMEALKKLLMQEPTHTTLLCEHFKSERAGGSELVAALMAKGGESAGDAQTAGHFESLPEFKCLQGALTYINILMQICKSEHSEQIKALCLEQWASPLGQELIGLLSKLYVFLSWEKNILKTSVNFSDMAVALQEDGVMKTQVDFIKDLCDKKERDKLQKEQKEQQGSPMEVDLVGEASPESSSSSMMDTTAPSTSTTTAATVESTTSRVPNQLKKFLEPVSVTCNTIHRYIEDLFSTHLLKLAVATPNTYSRRSTANAQSQVPTPNARVMAKQLAVVPGSWNKVLQTPVPPEYKFNYYSNFMHFTDLVLFDAQGNPYQLTLQNFVLSGTMDSYFRLFNEFIINAAYTTSSPATALPTYVAAFLEVWFMVLERLTNPDKLQSTPYSIPNKNNDAILANSTYVGFESMEYLIRVHRKAFMVMTNVWTKVPLLECLMKNKKILNYMLTVLAHLFRTIPTLDKYVVRREAAKMVPPPPVAPAAAAPAAENVAQPGGVVPPPPAPVDASQASAAAPAAPVANDTSAPAASTAAAPASGSSVPAPAAASPVAPAAAAPQVLIGGGGGAASGGVAQNANAVHEQMLDMLVDMGFSRAAAADALIQTGYEVTAAAEWLLTHPNAGVQQNEFEMSEEDAMERAIAMSLEQDDDNAADAPEADPEPEPTPKKDPLVDEQPLELSALNELISSLLTTLLNIMDSTPDANSLKCGEVLFALLKGIQDEKLSGQIIKELVGQILACGQRVLASTKTITKEFTTGLEWSDKLKAEPDSTQLCSRLTLFALLCNESKGMCLKQFVHDGQMDRELPTLLHQLLEQASICLKNGYEKDQKIVVPKWLCPVMLLLGLLDKYELALQRREYLLGIGHGVRQWKVYQDRASRWSSYELSNNTIIDEAFRNGETYCRITAEGGRKYTIRFDTMTQSNDSSGNSRPVMFVVKTLTHSKDSKKTKESSKSSKVKTQPPPPQPEAQKIQVIDLDGDDDVQLIEQPQPQEQQVKEPHLFESYISSIPFDIIQIALRLTAIPLDPDNLNALLRLVLRATQFPAVAEKFAEKGGIARLMALQKNSTFNGISSMTLLIIRHVFEDDESQLRAAMEREVRKSATASAYSYTPGMVGSSQELYNVMRSLAPAACRDMALFRDVTSQQLKINIHNKVYNESDDKTTTFLQLTHPATADDNAIALADEVPPSYELSPSAKGVVEELLNLLPQKWDEEQKNLAKDKERKEKKEKDNPEELKSRSLFQSNNVLSFLSELVINFQGVAKVVCEHSYSRGFVESITDDCTALSFILDEMVNNVDSPSYPKLLIAAIASVASKPTMTSCTASQVHTVIINEIKQALSRALHNENSANKHIRIEALASLITLVIDSCPRPEGGVPPPNQSNSRQHSRTSNANCVVMIKAMSKSGIVNDLAKASQALDLSSPKVTKAIDAVLKTLEIISETLTYVPKSKTAASATANSVAGSQISNAATNGSANINNAYSQAVSQLEDIGIVIGPTGPNDQIASVLIQAAGMVEPLPTAQQQQQSPQEVMDQDLPLPPAPLPTGGDVDDGINTEDDEADMVMAPPPEMMEDDDEDRDDDDDEVHVDDHVIRLREAIRIVAAGGGAEDDHRPGEDEDDDDDDDEDDDDEEHHRDLLHPAIHRNANGRRRAIRRHQDDEDEDDDEDDEGEDDDDREEDDDDPDEGEEEEEEDYEEEEDEEEEEDFDAIPMPPPDLMDDFLDVMEGAGVHPPHAGGHGAAWRDEFDLLGGMHGGAVAFAAPTTRDTMPGSTVIRFAIPQGFNTDPLQAAQHPLLRGGTGSSAQSPTGGDLQDEYPPLGTGRSGMGQMDDMVLPSALFRTMGTRGGGRHTHTLAALSDGRTVPHYRLSVSTRGRGVQNSALRDELGSILARIGGPGDPNMTTQLVHQFTTQISDFLGGGTGGHLGIGGVTGNPVLSFYGAPSLSSSSSYGYPSANGSTSLSMLSGNLTRWTEEARILNGEYLYDTLQIAQMPVLWRFELRKVAECKVKKEVKDKEDAERAAVQAARLAEQQAAAAALQPPEEPMDASAQGPTAGEAAGQSVPDLVDQPMSQSDSSTATVTTTSHSLIDFTTPTTTTTTAQQVSSTAPASQQQQGEPMNETSSAINQNEAQDLTINSQSVVATSSTASGASANVVNTTTTTSTSQDSNTVSITSTTTTTSSTSESVPMDQSLPLPPPPTTDSTSTTTDQEQVPPPPPPPPSQDAPGPSNEEPAPAAPAAPPLTPELRAILGDVEIPEGIDPSYLAALPEDIRQEVIAEQLRIQRLARQAAQQQAASAAAGGAGTASAGVTSAAAAAAQAAVAGMNSSEISPEFLAALPPDIRQEVLAQQRAEQAGVPNPLAPIDPDGFIRTLPPSLRRQVLADMDDSQVQLLTGDLAQEARTLRREHAMRRENALMEEYMMEITRRGAGAAGAAGAAAGGAAMAPGAFLASVARRTGRTAPHVIGERLARIPSSMMTSIPMFLPLSGRLGGGGHSRSASGQTAGSAAAAQAAARSIRGKHLLDHESISTLLMLLFVPDSVMAANRLHRLVRNICYHTPTKQWIVNSLLQIVERAKQSVENAELNKSEKDVASEDWAKFGIQNRSVSWLSISFDSAFGAKTSVFQLDAVAAAAAQPSQSFSSGGKLPLGQSATSKSGTPTPTSTPTAANITQQPLIVIHPQAASFVCRKVFDILIYLAKSFPDDFVSTTTAPATTTLASATATPKDGGSTISMESQDATTNTTNAATNTITTTPTSAKKHHHHQQQERDFFEVLLAHDSIHGNRKAKGLSKHYGSTPNLSSLTPVDKQQLNQLVPSTPTSSLVLSRSSSLLSANSESPFSQLINLLSRPFIAQSSTLTDRLIRLLHSALSSSSFGYNNASQEALLALDQTESIRAKYPELEKALSNEERLQLLVTYMTSANSSIEGLDDANSLMTKLSNIFPHCREIFHKKLLEAAKECGNAVLRDINQLMEELQATISLTQLLSGNASTNAGASTSKGLVQDRYTSSTIVLHGKKNASKGSGKELHLPSMTELNARNSNQNILLRLLDTVVVIRALRKLKKREKIAQQKADEAENDVPQAGAAAATTAGTSMDVDVAANVTVMTEDDNDEDDDLEDHRLSEDLELDVLWNRLSDCLDLLQATSDERAVLVLEPAVEAFFLVHAPEMQQPPSQHLRLTPQQQLAAATAAAVAAERAFNEDSLNDDHKDAAEVDPKVAMLSLPVDMQKFLTFAEKHRVVLNQILRQLSGHLGDGTFACLVEHARILDFDVKRRYFREELKRADTGLMRRGMSLHINRHNVFEDSFRQLDRLSAEEWKGLFRISFESEEGQDAGGLLREWYTIIAREIFNPNYALFTHSPGDGVTYMINQLSHFNSNHLNYFKFVGRLIGKAIYENQLLDCYFTRSFYKHMLGKPVKYTDMEAEDNAFYKGLVYLLENNVKELGSEMSFSLEVQEFGQTKVVDLKNNGHNLVVTEENKHEYVRLVCQEKMTGSIKQQLKSFLEGLHEVVPKRLISIFNEHELELLISGLPDIDIDDLQANTEYHKYQADSLQIQWFWRACRTFDQTDRAKLLQFVTGTSKVPLQGFAALGGGSDGLKFKIYRDDRSTDRLPCAHTCFNQLDLPAYETYDKLRTMLLKAIQECSEGFGFA